MSNLDHEESMQDMDATRTYWWTESQIRDEIHRVESPAEMFASRPSSQPIRRATEKERETRGIFDPVLRWLHRR